MDIKQKIINFINLVFRRTNHVMIPKHHLAVNDPGVDPEFYSIFKICQPYTLTRHLRAYSLYKAVNYIIDHNIPGSFVECGVLQGGNPMMIAEILSRRGVKDRKIFMYDVFDGDHPAPKDIDKTWKDEPIEAFYRFLGVNDLNESSRFSVDHVKKNLALVDYPQENYVFVKGPVEETIPGTLPTQISLLRLDTDWYDSTYHELVYLYPLLSSGGAIIVDDYSFLKGSKKATDQYFKEVNESILLNRVDYSAVIGVKR